MLFYFLVVDMLAIASASSEIKTSVEARMYLRQFGYMATENGQSASLHAEEPYVTAIKEFQRFAGLNETGILDNQTMTMMNLPRCGVPDRVSHGNLARRKRYSLQGSRWNTNRLTYRISKYPKRLKDRQKVDKEIARAFKVWGDVTPLTFSLRKQGRVHIDVRFEERVHGDGEPFDGPGGTLAHAFFPRFGGDAHFDDEEKWTITGYSGTNLFQVAAHEFGHSLGLSHSDVRSALMAPFYRGYQPRFQLDDDDIFAIQALYGAKKSDAQPNDTDDEAPSSADDSGDAPDLCQDSAIDAVTRTQDGKTYVFKGSYYWQILNVGIADGYPRSIKKDWDGLPDNLDAALTWTDGKTFFFKGDQYWRFYNKKLAPGYPKKLNVGFTGIPNDVDAAFVWSGNGKTYFFKGDQYWRFDSRNDPPVSDRYPRPISNWKGLPNDIDAAFQWENGYTYFFKGKNYYRFNDKNFVVDSDSPSYPRSTSVWWFDCRSISNTQGRGVDITDKQAFHEGDRKTINVTADERDVALETDVASYDDDDDGKSPQSSPQVHGGCERNLVSLLNMAVLLCALRLLV